MSLTVAVIIWICLPFVLLVMLLVSAWQYERRLKAERKRFEADVDRYNVVAFPARASIYDREREA
jgi:membrane-anchored protein YejM (alkaline phosphatase superfamily)